MFCDDGVDGGFEDFVHTRHFLAAALHVEGVHLLGDGLTLGGSNRCQALSLEQVDAGALVAEIGLEAAQDDRCAWAEMEDFRVPLGRSNRLAEVAVKREAERGVTLSMTFSSELGQSIAKQTNKRSVSGYERGRRRSYSSWPAVSHKASSTVLPDGLCSVWVM